MPFGLSLFIFAIAPNQVAYQDIGTLLARQPAVTAHWGQHLRASGLSSIQAATFSFARPIGTTMPRPLSHQLASLDPRMVIPAPWDDAFAEGDDSLLQFPTVDRSAKGDRQPVQRQPQSEPEVVKSPEAPSVTASIPPETVVEPDEVTAPAAGPQEPPAAAGEDESQVPDAAENATVDIPDPLDTIVTGTGEALSDVQSAQDMARIYFGNEPFGDEPGSIAKWAPGEEPTIVAPADPDPAAVSAPADADIKQSALERKQPPADSKGGESTAPKGQVTGEGKRPLTPAERLKLEGKSRTSAEKCLADAVYFEARGEPVRGQIAVAQVVMNRVFSGFYPRNVCGTVYQNKHRRLACQFTFACDGIPEVVSEPHAWIRATRIASDVLDGKYWLPEVNRATHYHAYWVRPRWIREMKRLYKVGVHSFYRPRLWGDGSDMPSWGTASATSEAIAKL